MSIAMERTNSGGDRPIERPGLIFSIYDDDRRSEEDYRSPSSSTSSIGKNSDECNSNGGKSDCEEEGESEYKGGPLDSLEDLEEVLPVKKGISNFYNGKSKSFTSLSDAVSCSSINEITKPENPYSKKRKNLLAFNNLWDNKANNNFSRSRNGGLSKRPSNSRSMVALATSMNSSDSNSGKTSNSYQSPPDSCLPPLPPPARRAVQSGLPLPSPTDKFSSWRSFSLSDLQGAAAAEAATSSNNGCVINNITE